MERLSACRWSQVAVSAASAVLRGSSRFYQGFAPLLGNAVMGVVFAEYYRRRRRVMPLVVAHTLLGVVAFVVYALGRAIGITVEVQASALNAAWWTVPVLILSAVQNALLEEVVVVGYLMERLSAFRWSPVAVIAASAVLRGSYHLYQGFGPFVGNAVMGVVFAEYYRRRRRVMPLVVAHTVLDIVAFVGYALVPAEWRTALGLS